MSKVPQQVSGRIRIRTLAARLHVYTVARLGCDNTLEVLPCSLVPVATLIHSQSAEQPAGRPGRDWGGEGGVVGGGGGNGGGGGGVGSWDMDGKRSTQAAL